MARATSRNATNENRQDIKVRWLIATAIHHQISVVRQHMRPQLEALQREHAQAVANYNAARGA
jgi:hypothetical protein